MYNFKFNLKDKVIDSIMGYRGTITCAAIYCTGRKTYLVENVDHVSRPVEWWIEEERLEKLDYSVQEKEEAE